MHETHALQKCIHARIINIHQFHFNVLRTERILVKNSCLCQTIDLHSMCASRQQKLWALTAPLLPLLPLPLGRSVGNLSPLVQSV